MARLSSQDADGRRPRKDAARPAEFFAECTRIAALAEAKAAKEKPGTLGLLIRDYRSRSSFQTLAPQTQSDYQKTFDYLRPIADTALVRFDRPLVVRIRDKAAGSKGRRAAIM
ncbi:MULTISPECIES: hypothetical protein [Methylosinus]|uniref:hypothetical protein n=1 Tax=Methylosinus TaxID=425 RepID=UPI0001D2E2FB|nr:MULTISPECIES: hypothetical protein [Methylosinus]